MVHALLESLAAAKHHGRGGAHPKLVRCAMHVHPLLHVALQPADALPDRIVEDLSSAAGDRIEPRIPEAGNGFPQIQAADFRDIRYLGRREAMQMNREAFLNAAEE